MSLRYYGLVAALLIPACSTAPDGSTLGPQESSEHKKCISQFGYEFGTPGYGQCRVQLAEIRNAENAKLAGSLQTFQQIAAPPRPVPSFSPTVTCHTFGVTTTCR